jgi:hypothetical protein
VINASAALIKGNLMIKCRELGVDFDAHYKKLKTEVISAKEKR